MKRKRLAARALGGFTLVEILVVIAIIATLSSIVCTTVIYARRQAKLSLAKAELALLDLAIDGFYADEGYYPGQEARDAGANAFPALYDAIAGDPRPQGRGGRGAPYARLDAAKVLVERGDASGEGEEYRPATRDERRDPELAKFYEDPWQQPYWYQVRSRGAGAKAAKPILWSLGPDRENQILNGKEEGADDLVRSRD